MNEKGKLYLLPSPLGASSPTEQLPPVIGEVASALSLFLVEHPRSARRTLISLGQKERLESIEFMTLSKKTPAHKKTEMISRITEGLSAGILSEAGAPGIADPGSEIVQFAHQKGIEVIPLPGPSAFILALMASGLNGQRFTFNGYLPVQGPERRKEVGRLENNAKDGTTQIFMETPYRNTGLLTDILDVCAPQRLLCIATDISLSTESIRTAPISQWKKEFPKLHKRPTVFLLGTAP